MTSTPLSLLRNFASRALLFRPPAGAVLHRIQAERTAACGRASARTASVISGHDEAHPGWLPSRRIFVAALVGPFGQKLMHQIAMCTMKLEHVEAGFIGAPRPLAPGLHQVLYLVPLQRLWRRPFLAMRDRARRYRLPRVPIVDLGRSLQRPVAFPRTGGARFAAGMTELDSGCRVLLLDEPDQTLQRLDEGVIPDTEVAHGAATTPPFDSWCRSDNHDRPAPPAANLPAFIRCQSESWKPPSRRNIDAIGGNHGCAVAQLDASNRQR